MRKFAFAAALASSTLALAACSGGAEDAAVDSDETAVATEVEAAAETTGVLDASTATAEQLAAVEGVSEELAAAIVAGQPFTDVTAFNALLLETLSAEEAAAVLEGVFVPVNLNEATEEQIRLIPGMTDKMVHEFEEYRPYEDMAEFDREIGKYVDEAEVARFRNYVTL
ncbi:helix-hairpin-helix domain-containing protein [Qipengyuania aquimaris]|uniref:Helix-hairpin-helix domain-containing protein n=1 Tax=Qipengyuania aquimaris TaxID=255984 RepID=A0A9Q3RYE1_9SPHN|nr:helix-hairpin-helix domain-containing protein [Qipengyuania aquimaris]MBY6216754.1 helix-hairpin-helix domain-containing protein [Qipengyuania aquimaris]